MPPKTQLLPLLIDMYGAGCLTNLTSLACMSDQFSSLVRSGLYKPLLQSARRFPCGLSVNIVEFRYQPLCFW